MEPRPHDPKLSESLQPLIERAGSVLALKMERAVNAVSKLKAQGKRVLIFVKEGSTATFYGACHRGIVLEMADDLEDVLRATRALTSIGQTQQVEWTNYYVQETLDMVHDLAVSRKAVLRLFLNPAMYPEIAGDLRGILTFHEVALSMGHAASLFYSAVAKLLKENPGAASKFKKSTMARIAKSWKPGQTLTMDHVNLKLPTIEDGVVLYNYVKDGYKQQL
ncbi:hypothetical protein FOVSG1_014916 [Fusarium oxysporum f. sp. vasinfectum]